MSKEIMEIIPSMAPGIISKEWIKIPTSETLFDWMEKYGGYNVHLSGKRDWTEGSHSLNIMLGSWTMYTRFPYNIPQNGGWNDQGKICRSNGTIMPGNESAHQGDWNHLKESLEWISTSKR
jgi:hypothetical protein